MRAATVRIAQAQTEVGGRILFAAPKTAHSVRTVSLPRAAVEALKRRRAELPAVPHGERLVFATAEGRGWRRSNVLRRWWHPLLERPGLPRAGFPALRHTFASHSLAAGVDGRVIADQLGHRDAALALGRYSHVTAVGRERLVVAADALPGD